MMYEIKRTKLYGSGNYQEFKSRGQNLNHSGQFGSDSHNSPIIKKDSLKKGNKDNSYTAGNVLTYKLFEANLPSQPKQIRDLKLKTTSQGVSTFVKPTLHNSWKVKNVIKRNVKMSGGQQIYQKWDKMRVNTLQ